MAQRGSSWLVADVVRLKLSLSCNCLFIQMLTENIMHDCVVKLLKSNDEEAFECLCKLLVTIGKDLDHAKAKVCTVHISCCILPWHVRNVKFHFRNTQE